MSAEERNGEGQGRETEGPCRQTGNEARVGAEMEQLSQGWEEEAGEVGRMGVK